MAFNVLVTRSIPEAGQRLLREADASVHVNPHDRPMRVDEIVAAVADVDGVLCLLTDRIDANVLEAASRCVGFANYAVGYENVDLARATELGIMVSNTPGVLTETTADLTWALLLATARRIIEGDTMVRQGRFHGWGPMLLLGADVFGRTLGIVGAGRIGTAVARRAHGFGMHVLYAETCGKGSIEALGATCVTFDELLRESDFVSLHVPLTDQTRHLIGREQLESMRPSAILINTSRGQVVDEKALIDALRSGVIAGAGLDVFEREPALTPGLADLHNVVVTPHIGSATTTTRTTMATMAAGNLIDMLRGRVPANLVNPEVLPLRRQALGLHEA
jgi:glyoxylate reductase